MTKPNLILYIGSLSPNCNAQKRFRTLKELGHNVIGIDIDKSIYVNNITASIHHRLNIGYGVYKLNKEVLQAVKQHNPDLIWVDNKPYLTIATLKKISKQLPNTKIINLVVDDANGRFKSSWRITPKTAKYYHHHFVQRIENFDEYYKWGAKKVDICLRSFDPKFHKKESLTTAEIERYSCEVGFIGSYEEEREVFIKYLIENGISVNIIGDGWENKKFWNIIKPNFISKGIYSNEYVKRLNATKIALHFIRVSNRDQQDSRTFEIPACGTFMIAQRTKVHEEIFEENVDVVFFDSKEELLEKCNLYLKDEEARDRIRNNGFNKMYSGKHDHSSRLIDVFNKIYGTNETN